jgi:hypothetical protein
MHTPANSVTLQNANTTIVFHFNTCTFFTRCRGLLRLQGLVRPHSLARHRKDHRGVDLISDALPFGRLWYGEPNAISSAIGYAKHCSRSRDAVIRVYDEPRK